MYWRGIHDDSNHPSGILPSIIMSPLVLETPAQKYGSVMRFLSMVGYADRDTVLGQKTEKNMVLGGLHLLFKMHESSGCY